MRINKFVAAASGLSRRAADQAIQNGRITFNQRSANLGDNVQPGDSVSLDGQTLSLPTQGLTLMLNKPLGYVCSRQGQGSKTIYDLLPAKYHQLKPAGRLDKDSSGLLILTNDGDLAQQLTHPRYAKTKTYHVTLKQPLQPLHQQIISDRGISLEDGPSRLGLQKLGDAQHWQVDMQEGRNRQIRRSFAALGYRVVNLKRLAFGPYKLGDLSEGHYKEL